LPRVQVPGSAGVGRAEGGARCVSLLLFLET
jgi:hypothetical protein